ncbi:EAL domain-containing protein [Frateuria terrea]|uniref:Diguanylate cyclase (GGDEF) domain-containing protein n=1 Tax=Frateuria terrea TaxID=529704 RepID=A0A1H6XXQ4_9GAMM|nr:EAL domain-containing protein [Frateuria terrea]SEJ32414.1 diguanylate cyclase (GGDEF) domain-containing protein [Frateuria terrea]SFP51510.1 diguanylate cyclase (GGDEF) domain-containing protein [Frateuria terrea]
MTRLATFVACLLALCLPLAPAEATKTLRVVGDNNYPPYLFIGPDGKPQGYVVDAWKLWESKTGVKVELTATHWADAQRRMRAGQADVIDMIFRTPERSATLDFTQAFATVETGIYADRHLTGIADVSGLRGFVVGVQRGDACVDRLYRAGVSNLRQYTNYTDIIDAARRGDIRIFCMDRSPAEYYLYRLHAQNDFVKAFDFYSDRFRRGVHKGDAATLALVEQGMARITPQERAQLHDKWMGQHVDLTGYADVFKAVASALALVGVVLLVWIYTLRRAVRKRTRDLRFLAHYDPLTSLPNRHLLLDRIAHTLDQPGAALSVLLIDLDNFKRINDRFGHPAADALLRQVADRLKALAGPVDTVARLGGDDFVVTVRSAELSQVTALAEQARQAVARGLAIDGEEVFLSASAGVSLYPHDGENGVALLKNADTAMSRAKQNGRNAISFYRASQSAQASHFVTMGAALRHALQRGEFELHYQPQHCLRSGTITGVEALLRWRRGDALVPPGEFIALAEELGLIEPLGEWVMTTACRQLALWRAAGATTLRMAVNLSARQLASPGIVAVVESALAHASLPADRLELEITESALVGTEAETVATLNAIRALGVHIAIDDFGTGYSSLAYLRRLPVTVVKIDKSFLEGVPDDPAAVEVISAIVAMSHALNLAVVAEGVETERQAALLATIGCDLAQGWFYGAAMAPEQITAALMPSPPESGRPGPRDGAAGT